MGSLSWPLNTLRPRQNGRHFADDIFKCIILNENVWIPIKISLEFVPKGPINNIPALVQIMAWRRPGDKPLSEPMMVGLPTHICVTRPQWVITIGTRAHMTSINSFDRICDGVWLCTQVGITVESYGDILLRDLILQIKVSTFLKVDKHWVHICRYEV